MEAGEKAIRGFRPCINKRSGRGKFLESCSLYYRVEARTQEQTQWCALSSRLEDAGKEINAGDIEAPGRSWVGGWGGNIQYGGFLSPLPRNV